MAEVIDGYQDIPLAVGDKVGVLVSAGTISDLQSVATTLVDTVDSVISDVAIKAVDSTVVHLANTETISGNKTFTSPITGNLSGNASTATTATALSVTLPISGGGTGQTSATSAINALLPSQSGQSGNVLGTDGTTVQWVTQSSGGGGGGGSPGGSNGQYQVNSSGSFSGSPLLSTNNNTLQIASQNNNQPTVVVEGTSGQTSNLQEWRDSTNTTQAWVGPDGSIASRGNIEPLQVIAFQQPFNSNYSITTPYNGGSPTLTFAHQGSSNNGNFQWYNMGGSANTSTRTMYLDGSGDLTISGSPTTGDVLSATHGLEVNGAVNTPGSEINFPNQFDSRCYITTSYSGAVTLGFQHIGAGNTGSWYWANASGTKANLSSVGDLTVSGAVIPGSYSDTSAPTGSLYVSTTSGKLTFRDSAGTAHPLY